MGEPRFRRIEQLGRGGAGRVWLAEDRLLGARVALKELIAVESPPHGLRREFATLSLLRHPNLVEVYDFESPEREPPFFTMEVVDGVDLATAVRAEGPGALVELAAEALRALAFLHDFDVLHRDLKPANMLVRRESRLGSRVVLLDFGLVGATDPATDPGVAGTLPYLAPELFERGAPTARSDLYALAVVLFEAIHGRTPFEIGGRGLADYIEAVRGGKRSRPALPEGYPDGLQEWFEGMLAPDPARRPAAAADALARLAEATGSKLVLDTNETRLARLASGTPPARAAQAERLLQLLEPSGEPRLIWIAGGPGMGKHRFMRWLAGRALADGWEVLHAPPGLDAPSDDPAGAVHRSLESLRQRAAGGPVVLLLEHVDEAGDRLADLLGRVARDAHGAPVRIVAALDPATIQHGGLRSLLDQSESVPTLHRIDLEPLEAGDLLRMAGRTMPGTRPTAQRIDWLLQASDGRPFVAEALLAERAWERQPGAPRRVPEDRALADRVGCLSPDTRRWLEALAALGGEATAERAAAVAGLDPARASACAAETSAVGLGRKGVRGWTVVSRGLAGSILAELDPAVRRALFRAAAGAIETGAGADERVAELWALAGEVDRAIASAKAAAGAAIHRGDPIRAAGALAGALRILPRRDSRRAELRSAQADAFREAHESLRAAKAYGAAFRTSDDDEERAELRARQAEMLVQAGRLRRARAVAEDALSRATRPAPVARAERAIGILLDRTGRPAEAHDRLVRALDGFREAGETGEQAQTYQTMGITALNAGRARARDLLRRGVELYEQLGFPERGLLARTGLILVELRAGRYDSARSLAEETARLAERHGRQVSLAICRHYLARIALALDRPDEALELAGMLEDQSVYLDDYRLLCSARSDWAQALLRVGRSAEARTLLDDALSGRLERVDAWIVVELRLVAIEATLQEAGADLERLALELAALLDEAERYRDPDVLVWGSALELERAARARDTRAVAAARRRLDELAARGPDWRHAHMLVRADISEARALLADGSAEVAQTLSERAARLAAETGQRGREAEALALHARALEALGLTEQAGPRRETARERLGEVLAAIGDEGVRRGFAELPWAAELLRDAAELGGVRQRRLVALYDMIRALNSQNDPDELLPSILDMAIEAVRAERGMILLRDPSTDAFDVRLARGVERETADDVEAYSRRIVEQAGAGEAILSFDALHDERFADLRSVSLFKIRSLICVPLRSRGEVVGTVYVDARRAGRLFGQEDLEFLEAFADHAALALENARSRQRLEHENRRLRALAEDRACFGNLVGRCAAMQRVFELIEKVAASELSVLILGETGTGKELVARAIHFHSNRAKRPFVSENCAALPETLLQSELFGHVRGAFTGAERDRPGLFETADGGTLFLDEVGDMSRGMQAQLLRVLQEGEVRRVGGERPIRVDVRTLLATHRRLEQRVRSGEFREDLLYRIQQFVIELPPLRERPGDVLLLAQHFLERIAGESGRDAPTLTRRAAARLERHDWPGNVRQLENTIRRLAVLAGDGPITEDLIEMDPTLRVGSVPADSMAGLGVGVSREREERDRIRDALRRAGDNRTNAAKLLGISRATIYRKIKEYGL